jgi:hypothetical protein
MAQPPGRVRQDVEAPSVGEQGVRRGRKCGAQRRITAQQRQCLRPGVGADQVEISYRYQFR